MKLTTKKAILIFNFQFYSLTAWQVNHASVNMQQQAKERTPTPQIAGERKLLLLITRYFFGKRVGQKM